MKPTWKHAALAVALFAAVAFAAAGCDDDDDAESGTSASQQAVDELTARVQRNEMVLAVLGIADLPFHDINESINDGEVPSNAIPSLRTLVRMTSITEWSPELAAAATSMHHDALELIDVIEANDIEQAKELSTSVHEQYHEFTVDAWDVLAPGAGSGDDHGSTTPGAGETPAADGHGGDETPAAGDGHDGMPEPEVTP